MRLILIFRVPPFLRGCLPSPVHCLGYTLNRPREDQTVRANALLRETPPTFIYKDLDLAFMLVEVPQLRGGVGKHPPATEVLAQIPAGNRTYDQVKTSRLAKSHRFLGEGRNRALEACLPYSPVHRGAVQDTRRELLPSPDVLSCPTSHRTP